MKKLCLFILVVLLLPVTSSFALAPPTATGQQILMPYAQDGDGYWSGVAIQNPNASPMTFSLAVYLSNGTYQYGSSFTVAAHAMKVDLLGNFFSGMAPSGRVSVWIRCSTDGAPIFNGTLFVGSDQGFAFQNYKSEAYTYTVPDFGPIVITNSPDN
jgi:hypothetical protein